VSGLERERKNINQSLLTLGRVITSLQCPAKNQRVPYRDSKLVLPPTVRFYFSNLVFDEFLFFHGAVFAFKAYCKN